MTRRRFVPSRDLPLFPSHWSCRIVGRWLEPMTIKEPVCTTNCADCGSGTIAAGEWYMVNDEVWEQAWLGRRKWWFQHVPGQEILCIGCLEARIGRTLIACDFTDVPVNDPANRMSDRLRDRLQRQEGGPRRRGLT
jgi:hypothetical protein